MSNEHMSNIANACQKASQQLLQNPLLCQQCVVLYQVMQQHLQMRQADVAGQLRKERSRLSCKAQQT